MLAAARAAAQRNRMNHTRTGAPVPAHEPTEYTVGGVVTSPRISRRGSGDGGDGIGIGGDGIGGDGVENYSAYVLPAGGQSNAALKVEVEKWIRSGVIFREVHGKDKGVVEAALSEINKGNKVIVVVNMDIYQDTDRAKELLKICKEALPLVEKPYSLMMFSSTTATIPDDVVRIIQHYTDRSVSAGSIISMAPRKFVPVPAGTGTGTGKGSDAPDPDLCVIYSGTPPGAVTNVRYVDASTIDYTLNSVKCTTVRVMNISQDHTRKVRKFLEDAYNVDKVVITKADFLKSIVPRSKYYIVSQDDKDVTLSKRTENYEGREHNQLRVLVFSKANDSKDEDAAIDFIDMNVNPKTKMHVNHAALQHDALSTLSTAASARNPIHFVVALHSAGENDKLRKAIADQSNLDENMKVVFLANAPNGLSAKTLYTRRDLKVRMAQPVKPESGPTDKLAVAAVGRAVGDAFASWVPSMPSITLPGVIRDGATISVKGKGTESDSKVTFSESLSDAATTAIVNAASSALSFMPSITRASLVSGASTVLDMAKQRLGMTGSPALPDADHVDSEVKVRGPGIAAVADAERKDAKVIVSAIITLDGVANSTALVHSVPTKQKLRLSEGESSDLHNFRVLVDNAGLMTSFVALNAIITQSILSEYNLSTELRAVVANRKIDAALTVNHRINAALTRLYANTKSEMMKPIPVHVRGLCTTEISRALRDEIARKKPPLRVTTQETMLVCLEQSENLNYIEHIKRNISEATELVITNLPGPSLYDTYNHIVFGKTCRLTQEPAAKAVYAVYYHSVKSALTTSVVTSSSDLKELERYIGMTLSNFDLRTEVTKYNLPNGDVQLVLGTPNRARKTADRLVTRAATNPATPQPKSHSVFVYTVPDNSGLLAAAKWIGSAVKSVVSDDTEINGGQISKHILDQVMGSIGIEYEKAGTMNGADYVVMWLHSKNTDRHGSAIDVVRNSNPRNVVVLSTYKKEIKALTVLSAYAKKKSNVQINADGKTQDVQLYRFSNSATGFGMRAFV